LSSSSGYLTSEIAILDQQLKELDNDSLIKVAEDAVDNPYVFFSPIQEHVLTVKSLYPIDQVSCAKGDRNCRWKDEVTPGEGRLKASRTLISFFLWWSFWDFMCFCQIKYKICRQNQRPQTKQRKENG